MTLKIKITHDQPGYDKNLIVRAMGYKHKDHHIVEKTITLKPGQSTDIEYVWDNHYFIVSEEGSFLENDFKTHLEKVDK